MTGEKIPVESLDTWRYPQAPLSGVLNFTANGTGSSLDPTYEARGTIADLYLGDEGVGLMSGRLRYVKETVVIEQLEAASPRLSVSGAGRGDFCFRWRIVFFRECELTRGSAGGEHDFLRT